MASSKQTSNTKSDVEETKTKETKTVETPTVEDEKKADAGLEKAIAVATGNTKPDVEETPKVLTVTEEDLKEPGMKDAGVAVGDDLATVASKFLALLKKKEDASKEKPETKSKPAPKVTKNEVTAEKNGVIRVYSKATWDKLGPNKNGWKLKVEAPKEAKGGK